MHWNAEERQAAATLLNPPRPSLGRMRKFYTATTAGSSLTRKSHTATTSGKSSESSTARQGVPRKATATTTKKRSPEGLWRAKEPRRAGALERIRKEGRGAGKSIGTHKKGRPREGRGRPAPRRVKEGRGGGQRPSFGMRKSQGQSSVPLQQRAKEGRATAHTKGGPRRLPVQAAATGSADIMMMSISLGIGQGLVS